MREAAARLAAQAVDKDRNDALVVFGPSPRDGLGQLSDGVQEILDVLDRIDEIVPPGTDVGTLDQAYQPPPWRTRACAAAPWPHAPQPDQVARHLGTAANRPRPP